MQGCVHDYPALVAAPYDFALDFVIVPPLSNASAAPRVLKTDK
jgi:hypothetical protein